MGLSLSTRKSIKGASGKEFKRILRRSDMSVIWQKEIQLFPSGVLTAWQGENPSDGIYISTDTCPDGDASVYTDASLDCYSTVAVDASGYDKLKLTYRTVSSFSYNSYCEAYIRVGSSANGYNYANKKLEFVSGDSSTRTVEIDVSGISGNVYISFHLYAICRSSGNSEAGTLYVDDLKLS